MKRILLLGKNGQIGWELERSLPALSHVVACDRSQADLSDLKSVVKIVREINPEIIVNAAAYTAVDKAEQDEALAMQVNGKAPGVLAEEAKRLGAILVHYSTDYVFDGRSSKPYVEEDITNPLNAYGRSKLAGEKAIQSVGGKSLIFRTSWVYGLRGNNFLLTMLRLAKEREELRIVNDQIGAPTWCKSIAETTTAVLKLCLEKREVEFGLYHLSSAGKTSWHDFAKAIFEQYPPPKVPRIVGISSSEYVSPAKRPAYSVLSNEKLKKTFSITLPDWKDVLDVVA